MKRQIMKVETDQCIGCALCVSACHEGAITMVGGKAKLLREESCDGLGNCATACPAGAIRMVEREAAPFDETLANRAMVKKFLSDFSDADPAYQADHSSTQWPVQLRLAMPNTPNIDGAHLLISAHCCAYVYRDFFTEFIDGKTVLIVCPKLDRFDYTEQLTDILSRNNIASITTTHMSVPCCQGVWQFVECALERIGKDIPWQDITIATDGTLVLKSEE